MSQITVRLPGEVGRNNEEVFRYVESKCGSPDIKRARWNFGVDFSLSQNRNYYWGEYVSWMKLYDTYYWRAWKNGQSLNDVSLRLEPLFANDQCILTGDIRDPYVYDHAPYLSNVGRTLIYAVIALWVTVLAVMIVALAHAALTRPSLSLLAAFGVVSVLGAFGLVIVRTIRPIGEDTKKWQVEQMIESVRRLGEVNIKGT